MVYVRSLLNSSESNSIRSLVDQLEWRDGLDSTVKLSHTMKKNLEAVPDSDAYNQIGTILMDALDRDREFHVQTVSKECRNLLISKTPVGGYYRAHHDVWGDYSTTVFLNTGYANGELCIDQEEYKLPIGHAVTYPTGTPHLVNEVTKGERIVAVFWTESMFKDPGVRSVSSDLLRAMDILGTSEPECLLEAKMDPAYLVSNAFMNLKRRHGV